MAAGNARWIGKEKLGRRIGQSPRAGRQTRLISSLTTCSHRSVFIGCDSGCRRDPMLACLGCDGLYAILKTLSTPWRVETLPRTLIHAVMRLRPLIRSPTKHLSIIRTPNMHMHMHIKIASPGQSLSKPKFYDISTKVSHTLPSR